MFLFAQRIELNSNTETETGARIRFDDCSIRVCDSLSFDRIHFCPCLYQFVRSNSGMRNSRRSLPNYWNKIMQQPRKPFQQWICVWDFRIPQRWSVWSPTSWHRVVWYVFGYKHVGKPSVSSFRPEEGNGKCCSEKWINTYQTTRRNIHEYLGVKQIWF